MNAEYRIMKKDDLKECAHLFKECFYQAPWHENWTEEQSYQRLLELFSYPHFIGYVICDHDKIIGMLCGRVLTYLDYKEMTLEEFCISKDYQGHGLGSQMLEYLKKELKERSVSSLTLNTLRGDLSQLFYAKNGLSVNEDIVCMMMKI